MLAAVKGDLFITRNQKPGRDFDDLSRNVGP